MRNLTLLLLAAAAGCGTFHVEWDPAPPQASLVGAVAIEVSDRRQNHQAGQDPSMVGNDRDSWGIPHPVRVDGSEALSVEVRNLFADAVQSDGIGVALPGQRVGVPTRLIVEIQDFWCEGYGMFHAWMLASVMIVDTTTGQVRMAAQPLRADDTSFTCSRALGHATATLYQNARGFFANAAVRAALVEK